MKRIVFMLLTVVCAGQMCLPIGVTHPAPGYISREDVTNLPPGNATTSEYDGRLYRFMSRSTNSCECTPESVNYLNPCSAFTIVDDEDLHYEVIQDGASIMFRALVVDPVDGSLIDQPASEATGFAIAPGSMNQNNTFIIGSVGKSWDLNTGSILGEQFLLIRGEFIGDYMFLESTQHATARKGDLLNDCQFELSLSFVRTAWPEPAGDDDGAPDPDDDSTDDQPLPTPANSITLAAPATDGYVVLSDWSVWSVYSNEYAMTDWTVGDPIEVVEDWLGADLTNLRTSEIVGGSYCGVGTKVIINNVTANEYGWSVLVFSDSTSWEIGSGDENVVRTWRVGDEVIVYEEFTYYHAINLRTGQTVMLFTPW